MLARADVRNASVDALPIPEHLPAFGSLLVDEKGWLWAEVYGWDPDQPKEWMIFDPNGEARGIVHTPPGLRLVGVGEDYVLGVWLDEFDAEYVRRHRLRRDATTAGGTPEN